MRKLIFSIVAAMSLCGCAIEGPENAGEKVLIYFDRTYEIAGTRSSVFGSGIENAESGAVIAVYDAATGRLDSQLRVASMDSPLELSIPARRMDIYVIGNMWLLDGSGTTREIEFPIMESAVSEMAYNIGGRPVGNGLRTETFAELDGYGIPVCGMLKDVDAGSGSSLRVQMERLFARVEVTIDHSGISAVPGVFRNSGISVKQANGRVVPFGNSGSKALSAGDILEQSDYESPMTDGVIEKFTFYVPENRMGVLLPGNTDPAGKDYDALAAAAGPEAAGLATYIEFSAVLDRAEGGFGGTVNYRFYPGCDNVSDFDLRRNTPYYVNMSFCLGSLFSPDWKISVGSDFSDSRLFCATMDPAFTKMLDRVVAVRKNRPATVYVYMNKSGLMGANELCGKPLVPSGYIADGPADCAFGADLSSLEQYGLTASYSPSNAGMTLSVSDPSRFETDREIPLVLRLYPGGKTLSLRIVTKEEIGVSIGDGDYYMGMKRKAQLRGYAGSGFSVSVSAPAGKKMFRTSSDMAKPMLDNNPRSFSGSSLDLYAYSYCQDEPLTMEFYPSDTFNDEPVSLSFKVYKPQFISQTASLKLLIDGADVPAGAMFRDRAGCAMPPSVFDASLYRQIFSLKADYSTLYGDKYVGFDGENFFIKNLGSVPDGDWIGSLINSGPTYNVHPDFLGYATVSPASDEYTEHSTYSFLVYFPHFVTEFPSSFVSDYYNRYGDGGIGLSAKYLSYGNSLLLNAYCGKTSLRLVAVNETPDLVRIEVWPDEESGYAPLGHMVAEVGFGNRKAETGTLEIIKENGIDVVQEVSLGQFAVFDRTSSSVQLYITNPRAAWLMKKHYEGGGDMPQWDKINGLDRYNRYISWNVSRATGPGQTSLSSGTGNTAVMNYCDFFPLQYPAQNNFSYSDALTAAGSAWLSDLSFKDGTKVLEQPLTNVYSGNQFLHLTISDAKIGYVIK